MFKAIFLLAFAVAAGCGALYIAPDVATAIGNKWHRNSYPDPATDSRQLVEDTASRIARQARDEYNTAKKTKKGADLMNAADQALTKDKAAIEWSEKYFGKAPVLLPASAPATPTTYTPPPPAPAPAPVQPVRPKFSGMAMNGCANLPAFAARQEGAPAHVTFMNNTQWNLKIMWVNQAGQLQSLIDLPANTNNWVDIHVGHSLALVKDTGECLGVSTVSVPGESKFTIQ